MSPGVSDGIPAGWSDSVRQTVRPAKFLPSVSVIVGLVDFLTVTPVRSNDQESNTMAASSLAEVFGFVGGPVVLVKPNSTVMYYL